MFSINRLIKNLVFFTKELKIVRLYFCLLYKLVSIKHRMINWYKRKFINNDSYQGFFLLKFVYFYQESLKLSSFWDFEIELRKAF